MISSFLAQKLILFLSDLVCLGDFGGWLLGALLLILRNFWLLLICFIIFFIFYIEFL